jgi:tetratricopeptide (TPR) repeat protein
MLALLASGVLAAGTPRGEFEAAMRLVGANQVEEGSQRAVEAIRAAGAAGDHASAYWWALQLARHKALSKQPAQRLTYFALAETHLEQRDRTHYKWRLADLPNYVQLLCEKETVLARQGRFGLAQAELAKAEARMAEWLSGTIPSAFFSQRWNAGNLGVYMNLLMDRADYQTRRGDLLAAKASFEAAVKLAEHYTTPAARDEQRCRTLNNFAILLDLLGHDRSLERIDKDAADLEVSGGSGAVAESSRIRRQSKREGPSEVLVAAMVQKSAELRAMGRDFDAVTTARRAASMLYELGELDRAEALFATVVEEAGTSQYRELVAEAYFWRGKARQQTGRNGAEEDLLAALQFYRKGASKPVENQIYKAYAVLLLGQNRLLEALPVIDEALRLNALTQASERRPELLAMKAEVLARLGHHEAGDALWQNVLERVAASEEMGAYRRLAIHQMRLAYLGLAGRFEERAAHHAGVVASLGDSGLTDFEKRSFLAMDLNAREPVPERLPEPQPAVAFQPAYVSTRALEGTEARTILWLMNPGTLARRGTLAIQPKGAASARRIAPTELEIVFGGSDTIADQPDAIDLVLDASATVCLHMRHLAPPATEPVSLFLKWEDDVPQTVRWDVVGDAAALGSLANISANLLWENPFYNIPLYHEVWSSTVEKSTIMDFRAHASVPCRLEMYRASDGVLLTIDANGDGSYHDEGDFVAFDTNRNAIPDTKGPLAVQILVFPHPERTYADPLDIMMELWIDDAWVPIGSSRILPARR